MSDPHAEATIEIHQATLDTVLGETRIMGEAPFNAWHVWGWSVIFRCPREVCKQAQPSGMVKCLICMATFTTKAMAPRDLSRAPGSLAVAARSLETPAEVLANAPEAQVARSTVVDPSSGGFDVGQTTEDLDAHLQEILESSGVGEVGRSVKRKGGGVTYDLWGKLWEGAKRFYRWNKGGITDDKKMHDASEGLLPYYTVKQTV